MKFNEYQAAAMRTAALGTTNDQLSAAGLGLAGEAGEVADHIKKNLHHGHALDTAKVAKELGDVLWYVALACYAIGVSMDDVAQWNIDKLKARYPDGFSSERSLNRLDEQPDPIAENNTDVEAARNSRRPAGTRTLSGGIVVCHAHNIMVAPGSFCSRCRDAINHADETNQQSGFSGRAA